MFGRICVLHSNEVLILKVKLTLEEIELLLGGESENSERLVGELHLLNIIDTIDGEHSLVDHGVESSIRGNQKLLVQLRHGWGQQLVEDVVVTLSRLLACNTRLLQKVELDISSSDLTGGTEVNSDELTLQKKNNDIIISFFATFLH